MPTLVDIAEHEPVVLFDSNALGLGNFPEVIYGVRKYAELDKEFLTSILRSSEEFLGFIREGNTFTVEEVIRDFENLDRIINGKQEFLNEDYRRTPPKYTRRAEEKRSLFTNIASNVFGMLRMARSKIFMPEDRAAYGRLYETLSPLFSVSLPPQISSQKYKHLYAAAFYLSLHQETSVALVVSGRQFEMGLRSLARRVLSITPPYPQRSNLEQFPIRLYGLPHDNLFTFTYTTKK